MGDLNAAALRDNPYGVLPLAPGANPLPGYHRIQGFVDPQNGDYHWYRQDADLTWSQKHGNGYATNLDASGHVITNPVFADNNYSRPGAYMGAPTGVIYNPLDYGPGENYSVALPVLQAPN